MLVIPVLRRDCFHGRTAAQHCRVRLTSSSIAQLRELIPDVPILGNGDIFSAECSAYGWKRMTDSVSDWSQLPGSPVAVW